MQLKIEKTEENLHQNEDCLNIPGTSSFELIKFLFLFHLKRL